MKRVRRQERLKKCIELMIRREKREQERFLEERENKRR